MLKARPNLQAGCGQYESSPEGWSLALVVAIGLFAGFGLAAGLRAQEPPISKLHVLAPEFPPPAGYGSAAPGQGGLMGDQPQAPPVVPRSGMGPGASPSPAIQQPSTPLAASGGVTWLNSQPLTIAGLRGKVVMIDFWEPTCINCIRTFPENKRLWERYRDDGFVLIGVEDPEFDIADSIEHVREAVKRFDLQYPIAVDYQFQIWKDYKNNSWPSRYLIDDQGYIRYAIAGEGDDRQFEDAIRELLKEAHPNVAFPTSESIARDVNLAAPDCGGPPTPEMYVGDWYGRGVLANPQGYHDGKTINYQPMSSVADGQVALSGRWQTDKNGMIYRGRHKGNGPGVDGATVRYHAAEIYAVMNVSHGHPSRVYIMQDGKYLTDVNKDVDTRFDDEGRSYIEVREPRMYYLVKNADFGSHTIELFPTAPGLTLNSFTFGNACQTNFARL